MRTFRFPRIFIVHVHMFVVKTFYHDPSGRVSRVGGQGRGGSLGLEMERVGTSAAAIAL